MILEFAVAAQILSFLIGFMLHCYFSKIRENNFFNSLSEDTLIKIQSDIENNDRKQYD